MKGLLQLKRMAIRCNDLVVVKKDLTHLEGKIDSIEDKLVVGLKSTTEKHNKDKQMLKELLEENDRKIKEVDENIQQQKNSMKKQEERFKCDECGEVFGKKIDLRTHIKHTCPKNITCDTCDQYFMKVGCMRST